MFKSKSIHGSNPVAYPAAVGGAFLADPANPPSPPAGAVATEILDDTGRVIAYAWVVKEHAGERFLEAAWDWYETFGETNRRLSFALIQGGATVASASSEPIVSRPPLELAK